MSTIINSCGVIPLKYEEGAWYVLLILHQKSAYWAFPKGKAEEGESPFQTAEREFKEETGLEIQRLLSLEPLKESYTFRQNGIKITKNVAYYIALVVGNIQLQEEEIAAAKWVLLEEAESAVSFKEAKNMCRQVKHVLSKIK